MIVITTLTEGVWHVNAGDEFRLEITNEVGPITVIAETITKAKIINFAASFRFALKDGTCQGSHFCGIFANKDELPKEIKKAKMLADLTDEQYGKFMRSLGCSLSR